MNSSTILADLRDVWWICSVKIKSHIDVGGKATYTSCLPCMVTGNMRVFLERHSVVKVARSITANHGRGRGKQSRAGKSNTSKLLIEAYLVDGEQERIKEEKSRKSTRSISGRGREEPDCRRLEEIFYAY